MRRATKDMSTRKTGSLLSALVIVASISAVGCGDDDNADVGATPTPTTSIAGTPTRTATPTTIDGVTPTATVTATIAPTTVTPTIVATPTPTGEVCGDGVADVFFFGGEECDDGNNRDGDGCSATCDLEPQLENFSRFETFEFARQSALGFCPPVGELFDVSVSRGVLGTTTFRWSILRDRTGCEDPFSGVCANRDQFARTLTADEVAKLRDAVRVVKVFQKQPAFCKDVAVDPCLVNSFRWDDVAVTDFECHTPILRRDEVQRLLGILNDLTR